MNLRLATILILGLGLSGCGDDGTTDDTAAGTAADSGTTAGAATDDSGTAMTSPATEGNDDNVDSTGAGCDPNDQAAIDQCIAMGAAQGTCAEVSECNCTNCVCELANCEADPGCTAIRQCAQETGCSGTDCLDASTCGEVIDANGGVVGTSAGIALALSMCNAGAGCPIACEGTTGGSDSGDSDSGGGPDSGGGSDSESGSSSGG